MPGSVPTQEFAVKKVTERVKQQMRASWRQLQMSLLRLTYRVQDRLERRLINPEIEATTPR